MKFFRNVDRGGSDFYFRHSASLNKLALGKKNYKIMPELFFKEVDRLEEILRGEWKDQRRGWKKK